MQNIDDIVRGIQQNQSDEQAYTRSQGNTSRIAEAISKLELKTPDTQKFEWGFSINGLQDLFGEMFQRLEDIAQKETPPPEIVLPEPKSEIKVTDLNKVVALLQRLASKPETKVTIPDFPRKITVDNLTEIVDKLDSLVDKEEKTEERPTGYSFEKDESGNLAKVTEMYPSGNVVSEGWNLGRVRITDDRKH